MLFVEWWLVKRLIVLTVILLASCAGFWFVRRKRKPVRAIVRVLVSPVALLAGLFLVLQSLVIGCLNLSSPLYSPDHTHAARIRTDDEGAMGGNTYVELFWNHGFSEKDVYWGEWRSVEPEDLQWHGNSLLSVKYDPPNQNCESTDRVQVQCFPRPELAQPNRR